MQLKEGLTHIRAPWKALQLPLPVTVTAAIVLAGSWALESRPACAAVVPGTFNLNIDPNSLVSPEVIKAVTNLVGFWTQHRPYEPATALGTQVGLDVSIEATLVGVPGSFYDALASTGLASPTRIPSLPIAKVHLHKGFTDRLDLGGSFFYFRGNKVLGTDAKYVIHEGEEGPTYAVRFCYTYTDVGFETINVSTKTFSPQLLMSRKLDFADPYLGVGLGYVLGTIDATLPDPSQFIPALPPNLPPGIPIPEIPPLPALHTKARVYGATVFGGVSLKVPNSGLRLTMEGSYHTAGTSTMGLKLGFTF